VGRQRLTAHQMPVRHDLEFQHVELPLAQKGLLRLGVVLAAASEALQHTHVMRTLLISNWRAVLTHYRPAMPFGYRKKYFTLSFHFSIVTI